MKSIARLINWLRLTFLTKTFNVKDFGAVGDGVHDDTAAIQAAIDYAHNYKTWRERAVLMVTGNYKSTGPITFYTDTKVKGE